MCRKPLLEEKLYTFVALLSPVLNVYGVSYSTNTFTFRELFIIVSIIVCLFSSGTIRIRKVQIVSLLFISLILLSYLLNFMLGGNVVITRVIRYVILLCFVFLFAEDFFDFEYAISIYKKVTIVACVYLLLQFLLARTTGYGLPGFIRQLPIRSHNLVHTNLRRRYYSIFEEPGYFGMYVSGYLLLSLFQNRKEYIVYSGIIISCLLSTSNTAISSVCFTLVLYLISFYPLNRLKSKRKRWYTKIMLIVIAMIGAYAFSYSESYKLVMYRLNYGTTVDNRFGGYSNVFDILSEMNLMQLLFGNCMQEYPIGGYALLVICFGILGFVTMACMMFVIYIKSSIVGKKLVILFLLLNIGCSEFIGSASTIIVYLTFAIASGKYEEYKVQSHVLMCKARRFDG